jgi:hypothetical protein
MVPEVSNPFSVTNYRPPTQGKNSEGDRALHAIIEIGYIPSSLPFAAKYRQILFFPFKESKNEGREVAIITVLAGI